MQKVGDGMGKIIKCHVFRTRSTSCIKVVIIIPFITRHKCGSSGACRSLVRGIGQQQ